MENTSLIGTKLYSGAYRIDYILKVGGFDITYCAYDLLSNQIVAIKEFYPRYSPVYRDKNTGDLIIPSENKKRNFDDYDYERFAKAYQRGLQQFIQEGLVLTQLNHPNVVQVKDVFEERNTGYLVTELLPEQTLRKYLDTQPEKKLPAKEVEELMEQLLAALATLHKVKVYHLDLRPENIFLKSTGNLILAEFGGVKQRFDTGWKPDVGGTKLVYVNPYVPHELVIWGQNIGSESDIFGLGVILYEMLTGNVPESSLSRLVGGENWKPKNLEEPWLSLVMSALKINPKKRPRSVTQWWSIKDSNKSGS